MLFYTIAGAGTVKMEYLFSTTKDGVFIEPGVASDFAAAAEGRGGVRQRGIYVDPRAVHENRGDRGRRGGGGLDVGDQYPVGFKKRVPLRSLVRKRR